MFAGIIENQAEVVKKEKRGGQIRFAFRFLKKEKRPLQLGESIAVNGVCLTASKILPQGFSAEGAKNTSQTISIVGSFSDIGRDAARGPSPVKAWVLDASVAAKWFLPPAQETLTDEAMMLLED